VFIWRELRQRPREDSVLRRGMSERFASIPKFIRSIARLLLA
jgi:hypothetical protein